MDIFGTTIIPGSHTSNAPDLDGVTSCLFLNGIKLEFLSNDLRQLQNFIFDLIPGMKNNLNMSTEENAIGNVYAAPHADGTERFRELPIPSVMPVIAPAHTSDCLLGGGAEHVVKAESIRLSSALKTTGPEPTMMTIEVCCAYTIVQSSL